MPYYAVKEPLTIQSMKQKVEDKLSELIPERSTELHASLFQAARYSLLGGGKRLRPLLTLTVAQMLGASIEEAITPACALELIHTYSLIHDDLPCMDDDDMRRGKPTVHKIYGEGHAVLTGDFLLTHAFEVISDAPCLSSEKKIELIRLLARQAGGDGMVGGQALDLMSEGKELSWDTLNFIHHHKTAALIGAAIEFGAIIAGANHQDRDLLRSIGYEAGLSFQIIDDILDVTGDEKTLGKPILSDICNNKSTAVTILGMEQAKAMAEKLLASVERKTKSLSFISSTFQMLLSSLTKRHF